MARVGKIKILFSLLFILIFGISVVFFLQLSNKIEFTLNRSYAAGTTRNVACSGTITSTLQTAINSSANGDIVMIGAGSCLSERVVLNDKNITIIGAGKGATIITTTNGFATISTTGANQPQWRISGFTLKSSGNPTAIEAWATGSPILRGPFRIDNIAVEFPNASRDGILTFWGPIFGLVNQSDFTQNAGATILTGMEVDGESCSYNYAWQGGQCTTNTLSGGTTASLAFEPGGYKNIYIENNTFTGLGSLGVAALDTAYSGGRIVFRNNALQNSILYSHWTAGNSVNHLWWEIYENNFNWTLGQGMYPMRLHGGGTGLIYNNTMTGFPGNYILVGDGRLNGQTGDPLQFCDGTHSWDGNAGDPLAPGWPCLSQIGRNAGKSISQIMSGSKQSSFPLYLWNNGPQSKCSNPSSAGAECNNSFGLSTYSHPNYFKSTPHPNGEVDWFKATSQPISAGTHTLTYAPFTYPYPIDAQGMPSPSGNSSASAPAVNPPPPVSPNPPPPVVNPPPSSGGGGGGSTKPTPPPSVKPTPAPGSTAGRHARGVLVNHNGTIYFLGTDLRYPFPSAAVFLSWGSKFEDVVPANSGDIAMPIGAIVEMKIQTAPRLPRGTLVNYNGTIYFLGADFKYPFPSAAIFLSWGSRFQDVVPANTGDIAMPVGPLVQMKN